MSFLSPDSAGTKPACPSQVAASRGEDLLPGILPMVPLLLGRQPGQAALPLVARYVQGWGQACMLELARHPIARRKGQMNYKMLVLQQNTGNMSIDTNSIPIPCRCRHAAKPVAAPRFHRPTRPPLRMPVRSASHGGFIDILCSFCMSCCRFAESWRMLAGAASSWALVMRQTGHKI